MPALKSGGNDSPRRRVRVEWVQYRSHTYQLSSPHNGGSEVEFWQPCHQRSRGTSLTPPKSQLRHRRGQLAGNVVCTGRGAWQRVAPLFFAHEFLAKLLRAFHPTQYTHRRSSHALLHDRRPAKQHADHQSKAKHLPQQSPAKSGTGRLIRKMGEQSREAKAEESVAEIEGQSLDG